MMTKCTFYKIEEAKYLIDRFVKHDEKPNFEDVPKHYIIENTIFHNRGYEPAMFMIKAFCNNNEFLEKCKTCPRKEFLEKGDKYGYNITR